MTVELPDAPEEEYEDLETVIQKAAMIAAPIFKREGWTWWMSDEPPGEDLIAGTFMHLAEMCLENPEGDYCATGRLVVRHEEDNSGLSFSVDVGNWWATP